MNGDPPTPGSIPAASKTTSVKIPENSLTPAQLRFAQLLGRLLATLRKNEQKCTDPLLSKADNRL